MLSIFARSRYPLIRALFPFIELPGPFEHGPAFFSTTATVQAKPKETVKKGLHKVDRAASRVALKGIDAGVTATKKTKKTLGINGNKNGNKKKNGGRKNGGVGVKKNGGSLKGRR